MTKWIVVGLLIVMAGVTIFKRSEPWKGESLSAAVKTAAKDKKPLIAVVGAEWCGFCHKFQDETLPDAKVQEALRSWRLVKIDNDSGEGREIAAKYGVQVLPTILFLNPDGTEISRATGFLEPQEFVHAIPREVRK